MIPLVLSIILWPLSVIPKRSLHFLIKNYFYFYILWKKLFSGKMPLKCSNNAQCFCFIKMLENASIVYIKPSIYFKF